MKRNVLCLLFCTVSSISFLKAQYFTVSVAGGYAWPGFINNESVQGPLIDPFNPAVDALAPLQNLNDSTHYAKNVHGSYGQGMNFTLGLGYMINPYIGVDLGISYLKSANIDAEQIRQLTTYTGIDYAYIPYYLDAHITTNATGLSVMPSVHLQLAKPGWKIYPYTRVGITLPVAGGSSDHISISQDAPGGHFSQVLDTAPYFLGRKTEVTLQTQGSFSLGINGAIGVKYTPIPFLSVFLEVNGQYLTTNAKSAKITQWDATNDAGQTTSLINERGVYRTQFNFVSQLTGTSNNAAYNTSYNPNKPKDDLAPTAPFSNLGLNIGLTFNLSKQILANSKPQKKAAN